MPPTRPPLLGVFAVRVQRIPLASARRNQRLLVVGQGVSFLGDHLAFFLALPVFGRDRTGSAGPLGSDRLAA